MSKPGPKKAARQQKKHNQRLQRRKNRAFNQHIPVAGSGIEPVHGEIIGAPTAGASWLGQRIASLVRRRALHRGAGAQ